MSSSTTYGSSASIDRSASAPVGGGGHAVALLPEDVADHIHGVRELIHAGTASGSIGLAM